MVDSGREILAKEHFAIDALHVRLFAKDLQVLLQRPPGRPVSRNLPDDARREAVTAL
jgi:hypothetical protein